MPESQLTIDVPKLRKEMFDWLSSQLDKEGAEWIRGKMEDLWNGGEDWDFFSSFSAVPRYTGKVELDLSKKQVKRADEIRPQWEPADWSVDQFGRTLLVMSIANRERDSFLETLEKTFTSSDMGEAEALYKSLPVLPWPDRLQKRAAEGIRSNMTSVFNAVALRNPYPSDYFDEGAWNQMVLKALFVDSPLYLIRGIDRRANRKLADMLVDYAHERWAADRSVSPELWRPVGPFAEGAVIDDLQKLLNHSDEIQRQAAVLALSDSPSDKANTLLEKYQSIKKKIDKEKIDWNQIGRRVNEKS